MINYREDGYYTSKINADRNVNSNFRTISNVNSEFSNISNAVVSLRNFDMAKKAR